MVIFISTSWCHFCSLAHSLWVAAVSWFFLLTSGFRPVRFLNVKETWPRFFHRNRAWVSACCTGSRAAKHFCAISFNSLKTFSFIVCSSCFQRKDKKTLKALKVCKRKLALISDSSVLCACRDWRHLNFLFKERNSERRERKLLEILES